MSIRIDLVIPAHNGAANSRKVLQSLFHQSLAGASGCQELYAINPIENVRVRPKPQNLNVIFQINEREGRKTVS
jgi:hypothetical protein